MRKKVKKLTCVEWLEESNRRTTKAFANKDCKVCLGTGKDIRGHTCEDCFGITVSSSDPDRVSLKQILKEYHERKALQQDPPCPTCKGKKYVVRIVNRDRDETEDVVCPGCDGQGKLLYTTDPHRDGLD